MWIRFTVLELRSAYRVWWENVTSSVRFGPRPRSSPCRVVRAIWNEVSLKTQGCRSSPACFHLMGRTLSSDWALSCRCPGGFPCPPARPRPPRLARRQLPSRLGGKCQAACDESGLSDICEEGPRMWGFCSANLFFTLIFPKFNLPTGKNSKELNCPPYEPAGIQRRALCSKLLEANEELPAQWHFPCPLNLTYAWGCYVLLASSTPEQARRAHVGVCASLTGLVAAVGRRGASSRGGTFSPLVP